MCCHEVLVGVWLLPRVASQGRSFGFRAGTGGEMVDIEGEEDAGRVISRRGNTDRVRDFRGGRLGLHVINHIYTSFVGLASHTDTGQQF